MKQETWEYEIVRPENMENILALSDVSPDRIYREIFRLKEDVIYVAESGVLLGVISIGDLLRYYKRGIPLRARQDFRFIDSFDVAKAVNVLADMPSIHELPVVGKDGKFLGLLRLGRKQLDEWEKLKEQIDNRKYGDGGEYLYQEFKTWLLRQKATILIYDALSWEKWEENLPGSVKMFQQRAGKVPTDKVMPIYVLQNMTETQKRVFFGENYRENCIDEFMSDYEKTELTWENGIYSLGNLNSKYYTFRDGYRITPNNTGEPYQIHFYGSCHILGSYVPDDKTIEYFLKEELETEGYSYDVVNGGLWKGRKDEVWINRMLRTNFKEDDIVIIAGTEKFLKYLKKDESMRGKYTLLEYFDNAYAYKGMKTEDILNHFLDSPRHHDAYINYLNAKKIMRDITPFLKRKGDRYFIPWEIVRFYRQHAAIYGQGRSGQKIGSIVMSCNPFTKGHRYLIEWASREVELLYIFVVQDEVPGFSFKDRFAMVKRGVQDLEHVVAIPSGNYLVTKETFPQYFDRDHVVEIKEAAYEMHIFAGVIAKEFGVTYRFAGEEPIDRVTKAYNEAMKRILPQHDVQVVEIPRKNDGKGFPISASTVRRNLREGNAEKCRCLLPETTLEYLEGMGILQPKG